MDAVLRATQGIGTGVLPPPFVAPLLPALCIFHLLMVPRRCPPPQYHRCIYHSSPASSLPSHSQGKLCSDSLLVPSKLPAVLQEPDALRQRFWLAWLSLGVKLPAAEISPTCSQRSTNTDSAAFCSQRKLCLVPSSELQLGPCSSPSGRGDGWRPVLEQGIRHWCCILHLPNPPASSRFAYT